MHKRVKQSIRHQFLRMMLLCWMLPVIVILVMMNYYIGGDQYDNAIESYNEQMKYGKTMCTELLDNAITSSRNASYDETIKDAFELYVKGEMNYYALHQICTQYLTSHYKNDPLFYTTILWFYREPVSLRAGVFNESTDGSYHQIKDYWTEDHIIVQEKLKDLDTAVGFFEINDKLYMVRNMMSSDFKPYAALVMQINKDVCFRSLNSLPTREGLQVYINEQLLFADGDTIDPSILDFEAFKGEGGNQEVDRELYFYNNSKKKDYRLDIIVKMDNHMFRIPFYGYEMIIAVMIILLIPLLLFEMFQLRRKVTDPVRVLTEGSEEIEKGNLGYQIEGDICKGEFRYLQESFNKMSHRLKVQFDRIYSEEMALRDAKIMALQSNINPHFMNNTLEIINWEARFAGDIKVTKMIEALSTLMDAAMDRHKKPEVKLSEEMIYVNAYLYITKERLGKRLEIVNKISEDMLGYYVPRLIMQPIIENAIEHGIVPHGRGEVTLDARVDGDYLILEVMNAGNLTEKDIAHTEELLSPGYNPSKPGSSGSLGIANVNQRLKIIYGPECGLSIYQKSENLVVASLKVLIHRKEP